VQAVTTDAPDGFERFAGGAPFIDHIGPVFARGDGEDRVFALRVDERHLNARGTAQGGLLATFVDFAVGRAIEQEGDEARATVSLTTDFLGPVEPGTWVEARTNVDRLGGTLAFADCALVAGDREVVRARAVFAAVS
jgi:uncharacterized protein (TIGR00369 family)